MSMVWQDKGAAGSKFTSVGEPASHLSRSDRAKDLESYPPFEAFESMDKR